jgi:hypothetical protein
VRPSRGLLVGVVLLAALAGGVYWSNKSQEKEQAKPPKDAPPALVSATADQVQQISIKRRGTEPVVLKRDNSNKWTMATAPAYPVDQTEVAAILSGYTSLIWDKLVDEKATDLAQYGLQPALGETTFALKDGKQQTVFIGDDIPTGGDTYAKLQSDPRVFTISASNKAAFFKSPADLRDKRLLTFDPDKITSIDLTLDGKPLELAKNNANEWQITKPKPLRADGFQVEELLRQLKDAKMDLNMSEDDKKKAAASWNTGKLVAGIKVTDNAGAQQLDVHKNYIDNVYTAKSSAVPGIFKIAIELGDVLLKGPDNFRNKKLFDFGFNEPGKVEIHDGDKTYLFTHSGDKWISNGKAMDGASFQMMLDKLRDLAASKFADKGFEKPVLQATVTSSDGHRSEKVLISKTGDNYFAMRENEPATYELDPKSVTDLQKAAADVKPAPATPAKK